MRKTLATLACLGVLAGATGQAQAYLIRNGGFEEGGSTGNSFITINGDGNSVNTTIPGWTVVGSLDWINQYWQPSEGSHSIDLAGEYKHAFLVSDPFRTTIGTTYRVTFDMAGNPDQLYQKSLQAIYMNDPDAEHLHGIYDFHFDQVAPVDGTVHTASDMGWKTYYFDFVAAVEESQIAFTDVTNDNREGEAWGAALDNVRVEPVPEPSTLLLLGAGLAGLGIYRRKGRRLSSNKIAINAERGPDLCRCPLLL